MAAPWRVGFRLGGVPLPARKFGGEMRGTAQTASEHDWQSSARPAWHARDSHAVLRSLKTRSQGLDDREAAERVRQAGSNVLPAPAAASALRRLLQQFDNVLIYVTSELGNPNLHSSAAVPTLLAGGANVPPGDPAGGPNGAPPRLLRRAD